MKLQGNAPLPVYNIIDNALKFQAEGNMPRIKITSEMVIVKRAMIKTGDQRVPFPCISFTDNGIGFNTEDSKRIFNMFERLHTRKQFAGVGIGLTISWKITEAHGGFIESASSLDSGSAFRCYLGMSVT
jgi:light-regulated signal transduction histidine kinase (bacteriophytochrome)